jgi:hypothetical protein
VVYFIRPEGTQAAAFAELCPAVTLECGQQGESYGVARLQDYLEACLQLSEIPEHPVPAHDLDLFHSVAVIKVPEEASLGFGDEDADIRLLPDLERLNFSELPANTLFGWCETATRIGCGYRMSRAGGDGSLLRYVGNGSAIACRSCPRCSRWTRRLSATSFGTVMERMNAWPESGLLEGETASPAGALHGGDATHPHLLVAASAHGFGHLAQTAEVVNALRRRVPGVRVTVHTALPRQTRGPS